MLFLNIHYKSGAVITYRCSYERTGGRIARIENTPVFHDNSGIEKSPQLELFDVSAFSDKMRYVTQRPKNRKRRRFPIDATQLFIEAVN